MDLDLNAPIKTLQQLLNDFWARVPETILGIVVLVVFVFLGKLVRSGIRNLARRHTAHENVALVLARLIQLLVIALGLSIFLTITIPSVQAKDVVQLLGISSIAIGFAFKDILQNFLAGILILLNQPFKLRDEIQLDEYVGTVEDIQTRATLIRTFDGRRIVVPNSKVFTEAVVVNTAFPSARTQALVGIGYGDDIEKAKALMLEAMRSVEGVLADPAPDTIVKEFGGSSVNILARWWSKPQRREVLIVQDRVFAAIKTKLSSNGIDLPFPTTQVLFHDQTESTDGDRRKQREGWPARPQT